MDDYYYDTDLEAFVDKLGWQRKLVFPEKLVKGLLASLDREKASKYLFGIFWYISVDSLPDDYSAEDKFLVETLAEQIGVFGVEKDGEEDG